MLILAYLLTKAQENKFIFNRKEIYKNLYKDPNCLIKKDQCKNRNIFGQHASNGPNVERNFTRKRDIDFSVTKIMFYDKFKKFTSNTSKGNRVFEVSEFSKHDLNLTSGKSFGYPKQMHATDSITKYHNYGINNSYKNSGSLFTQCFQAEFSAGTCNNNRFRQ